MRFKAHSRVTVKVCELEVTIAGGAPRQVSEVHEEVRYSARLGGYTDGTWLQLMCCTYSDVLSLYFRGRDKLRFRERRRDKNWICDMCDMILLDFRLRN